MIVQWVNCGQINLVHGQMYDDCIPSDNFKIQNFWENWEIWKQCGDLEIAHVALVREAEVQKYMFTYHIEGQFNFMFILYLQV